MSKSLFVDKPERNTIFPGSPSTADRMEARGAFPKRFTLAPGNRRVYWKRSEIEQWLRDRGIELDQSVTVTQAPYSARPEPAPKPRPASAPPEPAPKPGPAEPAPKPARQPSARRSREKP